MTHSAAFYIGRFQPFHKGHLDAIEQILKRHSRVIIGIGSSQYSFEPLNPFPAELREEMIKKSLKDAGISGHDYTVVHIPDINDDKKWVKHIRTLCPEFSVVYSGTAKVKSLFLADGRHEIVEPKFNIDVSGTMVRKKMEKGEDWEKLVPEPVPKIIKQFIFNNYYLRGN